MNRTGTRTGLTRLILLTVVACVMAAMLFLLLYRYDNKYTAPGPQPRGGVLTLSDRDLEAYPMLFLVRDWEIYRGRLLTPEDWARTPPVPDELTFIGQYGGFEGKNRSASPHGAATYRLRLVLPKDVRSYTLELPEIYSAYRLYIDGEQVLQMGEPGLQGYRARTGNTSVTVRAAGSVEVLIAVADYGYLYSGMVYPPAFGMTEAVEAHLSLRLALRTAAVAAAACIGLLSLVVYALIRVFREGTSDRSLVLLYALLCFCLVGYIGYPVVKTLFPGGLGWYFFENFCYCLIYLLVGLIQHRISGLGDRAVGAFAGLGLFVGCCSLLVPLAAQGNLALLLAYSGLLKAYTGASVLFLTAATAYSLYRRTAYSAWMAAGVAFFDCALVFDRMFPNFEPILTGWFTELAGAVLVALVGGIMAAHVARQYRLRLTLEERVEHAARTLELQSAYYPLLLEQEQGARMARHDLRHHLLMLRQLARQGDLAGVAGYLDEYDGTYLQPGERSYCKHPAVDMLLRLYAQRARQQQTDFRASAAVPDALPVGSVDLCVVLGNLLENALEATRHLSEPERWVRVAVVWQRSRLSIAVDNSFDGWTETDRGQFLSRKRDRAPGVGLTSVEAVCRRCRGSARFYADPEPPVFHSEAQLTSGAMEVPEGSPG